MFVSFRVYVPLYVPLCVTSYVIMFLDIWLGLPHCVDVAKRGVNISKTVVSRKRDTVEAVTQFVQLVISPREILGNSQILCLTG